MLQILSSPKTIVKHHENNLVAYEAAWQLMQIKERKKKVTVHRSFVFISLSTLLSLPPPVVLSPVHIHIHTHI